MASQPLASGKAEHWPEIARLWAQVGPPLRPAPQDLQFVLDSIQAYSASTSAHRVLILGVTPELYSLPWPDGTDVLAIDHTRAMIDAVWPGPRSKVVCGEWTAIPLRAASRDIVLCDGGLHLLAHPLAQKKLARMLGEIVAPGGLCVFRLFVPGEQRETPTQVLQDLVERKIPNLNILKLRLAMAMQQSSTEGVDLATVWSVVNDVKGNLERLAASIGWPLEHLKAINSYQNSRSRYHFVSVQVFQDMYCEETGTFETVDIRFPSYQLGERCPTVVIRRTDFAHA